MRLNWYITVFFISGCCAGGSDLNEEFWSQFEDNEMLAINPDESTEQRHFTDALNEELPFQDLAADELFWDQFQNNLELPPPARSSSPLLDTIGDYTYPSWLIEEPEDVTSHPSQLMATQPVDLIPQTPGTLLTNALGDLNFLSPSVFSADTNPFDTLFGTLSVPISAPTRIQNSGVEFLGPTLPIIPSTSFSSPEHIPPDDTPIFEPPSRAATPEAGASHIQDGKIAKPRSRHRINRTPSDSGQVIRGRSIPNKKTKDRPWQCDQCQRAFGRQEHLKRHYRTHTNERPFVCDVCGRSFSRIDNRAQHLVVHTNRMTPPTGGPVTPQQLGPHRPILPRFSSYNGE